MENKFIMFRDGMFNEEVFEDLNFYLERGSSVDFAANVRTALEIVLKNIIINKKLVVELNKGNANANPREIAARIWKTNLAGLLYQAYASEVIGKDQFKEYSKIKDICKNVIHRANSVVLTPDARKELHANAKIMFEYLTSKNDELRKEWKTKTNSTTAL